MFTVHDYAINLLFLFLFAKEDRGRYRPGLSSWKRGVLSARAAAERQKWPRVCRVRRVASAVPKRFFTKREHPVRNDTHLCRLTFVAVLFTSKLVVFHVCAVLSVCDALVGVQCWEVVGRVCDRGSCTGGAIFTLDHAFRIEIRWAFQEFQAQTAVLKDHFWLYRARVSASGMCNVIGTLAFDVSENESYAVRFDFIKVCRPWNSFGVTSTWLSISCSLIDRSFWHIFSFTSILFCFLVCLVSHPTSVCYQQNVGIQNKSHTLFKRYQINNHLIRNDPVSQNRLFSLLNYLNNVT